MAPATGTPAGSVRSTQKPRIEALHVNEALEETGQVDGDVPCPADQIVERAERGEIRLVRHQSAHQAWRHVLPVRRGGDAHLHVGVAKPPSQGRSDTYQISVRRRHPQIRAGRAKHGGQHRGPLADVGSAHDGDIGGDKEAADDFSVLAEGTGDPAGGEELFDLPAGVLDDVVPAPILGGKEPMEHPSVTVGQVREFRFHVGPIFLVVRAADTCVGASRPGITQASDNSAVSYHFDNQR